MKCTVIGCSAKLKTKEDFDRHLRIVHGWIKLVLIFALALISIGCHKKDNETANIENIGGVWTGTLNINGTDQNVFFILAQNGNSISYGNENSIFRINYGQTLSADVSGNVSGRTFTLIGDEGSACVNKWSFSGEVSNGLMLVGITGNGNNVPGASCYLGPLNQTFTLHR